MTLEIISPTGTLFHGEATRVTLPGTVGSFTVLQDLSLRRQRQMCIRDSCKTMRLFYRHSMPEK